VDRENDVQFEDLEEAFIGRLHRLAANEGGHALGHHDRITAIKRQGCLGIACVECLLVGLEEVRDFLIHDFHWFCSEEIELKCSSVVAAVESGRGAAVVGEFITAVAGDRVRFVPFVSGVHFLEVGLLYRQSGFGENIRKLVTASLADVDMSTLSLGC